MNFQKFVGIFLNTYTARFLILLATQKLSTSAETNNSDLFYLIQQNAYGYKDPCLVVSKSNILRNGIFTPISGSSCIVKSVRNATHWSEIVVKQPEGVPEIGLTAYRCDNPEPKLIYRMDKSFITDVFRNHDDLPGLYAMNKKSVGSLFAKLLLDHYGNSSFLDYMSMDNNSLNGFIRFFLRIESKSNADSLWYGQIILMNSSINVPK